MSFAIKLSGNFRCCVGRFSNEGLHRIQRSKCSLQDERKVERNNISRVIDGAFQFKKCIPLDHKELEILMRM